jgi:MFS family permease
MVAQALADRLSRRGIHYGWVIVAVTFLTSLTTAGAMGLPGALILPLSREFGWDIAEISSAIAIPLVLYGLMAPVAAALIESYGVRRIVIAAITLIVSGLLLALVMTRVGHLVLLWGIVVGIGSGMTALVLGAIIATRWFVARRGLVVGLLTASAATGQLVFLPLAAWLVDHVGWRFALLPTIGALMAVGLLVVVFMRDRPSDLGLAPFGEAPTAAKAKVSAPPPAFTWAFTVLRGAASSVTFWVLAGTFFICGLSTNGLIQSHFISLCADYGMPAVEAASTLAMMGMFDLVGTVGSGWLSDRYDGRALLWAARHVAAVPAVLDLHALRPVLVRRLLWSRLDRHGAADGAAGGAGLRTGTIGRGVRVDFREPPGRRGCRGVRWRPVAQRAQQLSPRVLCRGFHVPGGGNHGLADPPPASRGGACGGTGLTCKQFGSR